jgi:glucose-6-phosphate 1-dehydrogenase
MSIRIVCASSEEGASSLYVHKHNLCKSGSLRKEVDITSLQLSISYLCKSISTSAQYVTLENKIKCLSLAVFFLATPPNKTVTGTANTWELLIANHLDQSL